MEINKSSLAIGIVILVFALLIFKPIQEKCFGEDKVECNYLDELNIEHLFYLVVVIFIWVIIANGKKQQKTLNNLLDVLISK